MPAASAATAASLQRPARDGDEARPAACRRIGTAWLGGWSFALFWFAGAAVVLWEWNRLIIPDAPPVLLGGEVAALGAAVVLLRFFWNPGFALIALGIGAGIALALAPRGRSRWAIGGLVYAAAVVAGPVILRDDAALGFIAILWLFALVWGTDVGAYFAGRSIGGPKLWRQLSPKKTWAGFVGGSLVGAALALVVVRTAGLPATVPLVLVSLVLAMASQGGDLFESFVKRRFSAKDAGTLIPGHGGVMDRLDGFLVAAILAAVIGLARGGFGRPAAGLLLW